MAATVYLIAMLMAAAGGRGWWPQDYRVERDEAAGKLTLATGYYSFRHDLKRGGVIDSISLVHGRAKNLLVEPIETRVRVARKVARDAAGLARWPEPQDIYSDLNDPSPRVSHARSGTSEIVTVEAALVNAEGRQAGVKVRTTFAYRWGYVKVRKELIAEQPVSAAGVTVVAALFDPSLSDYGYRPGVAEEMGNSPFDWRNGMIRGWGKMRPGTHLDLPYRTRYVPRYVVVANHGVEGIEWFVSDDLSQWDYQLTGQPGTGYAEINAGTDPLGVRLTIEPLSLPYSPLLERGGYLTLKGTYAFDYYFGVPILEGHAQKLWLHESARGPRDRNGHFLTEADVRQWAESGIREITVHNDGDGLRDGLFWRDGSYPPYPPEMMKKLDELIANCHKHGIRIAPYFSNHELHQSTDEFKRYGEEWGRKPDDQGNLRPNYYYGSHMCLKSKWLDFQKFSIDRVLRNHRFDGVYFDWNIAMYCNNSRHAGKPDTGVRDEKGLAALALSPAGHWDIDELIQLVEWARERVGPGGLLILHNTLAPMFTTENFADHVVGMEFGYGRVSVSMPLPGELPLEWAFAGARTRAVISIGTVAPNATRRVVRQHALAGLLTAVTPWRANPDAIEFVAKLKPLGEIERYRFQDWRNTAVKVSGERVVSALYSRDGEAYILLGNFNPEARTVTCAVRTAELPYPLAALREAAIVGEGARQLNAKMLESAGVEVTIPADGAVIIRLR